MYICNYMTSDYMTYNDLQKGCELEAVPITTLKLPEVVGSLRLQYKNAS